MAIAVLNAADDSQRYWAGLNNIPSPSALWPSLGILPMHNERRLSEGAQIFGFCMRMQAEVSQRSMGPLKFVSTSGVLPRFPQRGPERLRLQCFSRLCEATHGRNGYVYNINSTCLVQYLFGFLLHCDGTLSTHAALLGRCQLLVLQLSFASLSTSHLSQVCICLKLQRRAFELLSIRYPFATGGAESASAPSSAALRKLALMQ